MFVLGPLSPTLTQKLPPINLAPTEAIMLGYMPNRDDYDDFDKAAEGLVSQIGDKSVEDEAVEIALKHAHVSYWLRTFVKFVIFFRVDVLLYL